MKKSLAALAVLAVLFVSASPLLAHEGSGSPRPSHGRLHDELEHRAFHRELEHRDAHRYPMTWRQHERLHDNLRHDAYHDRLEHRDYHRSTYYRSYPTSRSYGYGYYGGYPSSGFSLRIGW